jgi:hypothetical protein
MPQLGRKAAEKPSAFGAEAEGVLAGFRQATRELEAKVSRGDLTPKVAREQAAGLAQGITQALKERAGAHSSTPRVFLDRLIEADVLRKQAHEKTSLEGLQRETNRLLRAVLVEQQIQVRADEFQARAYIRPVAGGKPAPTLESLLAFHQTAEQAGDPSALEWSRRELEAHRPFVTNPDDQTRIDRATDRPDRVNPRLIAGYVAAMQGREFESLERFVVEAIEGRDANACMASFLMAREAAEGVRLRWVRQVLEGVKQFPETAIESLRQLESQARAEERDAAVAHAEFTAAQVELEARMPGLEAPSEHEVARRADIESRPPAAIGEPIGLTLERRGALPIDPPTTSFEGDLPA